MIGILVISHGALGDALIDGATHVLGKRPAQLQCIAVGGRSDPDALLAATRAAIANLDQGDGVLILTDMVGGTPSNVATRALVAGKVAGVSGANLPMLVRVLTYRNGSLAHLVAKAISGGQQSVVELEP